MKQRARGVVSYTLGLLVAFSAVALAQVLTVQPSQKLYWDQDAASLAEAQGYRNVAYSGADADKALANPNDATLAGHGIALTYTCVAQSPTPTTTNYRCTSTTTAQQLAGTTAFGSYRVVIVGERKRADGTYAPKAVTQLCNFLFQDSGPSIPAKNLGFSD